MDAEIATLTRGGDVTRLARWPARELPPEAAHVLALAEEATRRSQRAAVEARVRHYLDDVEGRATERCVSPREVMRSLDSLPDGYERTIKGGTVGRSYGCRNRFGWTEVVALREGSEAIVAIHRRSARRSEFAGSTTFDERAESSRIIRIPLTWRLP